MPINLVMLPLQFGEGTVKQNMKIIAMSNLFGYGGASSVNLSFGKEDLTALKHPGDLVKHFIGEADSFVVSADGVKPFSTKGTPQIIRDSLASVKITNPTDAAMFFRFDLGCVMDIDKNTKLIRRFAQRGNGGIRGSIKERWQDDDYKMNIKTIVMSDSDEFPYKEMKKLTFLLDQPNILEISNKYLEEGFGITHIAIDSYKIDEVNTNCARVEIVAYSDWDGDILAKI